MPGNSPGGEGISPWSRPLVRRRLGLEMLRMVRTGSVLLAGCLVVAATGCSFGGGSSKAGGPAATPAPATRTVTVRFASGDPGPAQAEFFSQLARVSRGRVRAKLVRYDKDATDVDQRIARDLDVGRIDVADVAARAWESLGVAAPSAFQSPFLIGNEGLLDRATADPRIARPILRSLSGLNVTGLALVPIDVRYLFSAKRPLDTPAAFAGARVRISASPTTEDLLRALRARPTTAVRNGPDVVDALEGGRLDAVEADVHTAISSGYIRVAPHVASPIFAKVTTIAANADRLRALGPEVAGWLRLAAERAGAARRARDTRADWAVACGAGVTPAPSTPAELDALQKAVLDVHAGLEGDQTAALAINRIGLIALRERAADPWTRCGRPGAARSPTKVIDGRYEFEVSKGDEARAGASAGNAGRYRVEFAHGRYAVFHYGRPDPAQPGWDFSRDPVEVGDVVLRGNVATMRPATSIAADSTPKTYRFELFRDRLRWRHVSGPEDFLMSAHPWRKAR
jgi:TRAP-type C4-dicarboxylate transport system substrate-binding protein